MLELETESMASEYTLDASLQNIVTHFTIAQGSEAYGFGPELVISAL